MIITIAFWSCGSNTEQNNIEADSSGNTIGTSTIGTDVKTDSAAVPFSKTLSYKDVQVTVSSDNVATENKFHIQTTGLKHANLDEDIAITGILSDVLIDDIDADDAPEVFVITRQGRGDLATVYGFSANKDLSMSYISIPDFKNEAKAGDALRDGDEYMPVENSFVLRFPVYENGIKTGKTRQLQYKLKRGEAQKRLVFERASDY